MNRALGSVLLVAVVGVAGCSEALRFLERKVACPDVSAAALEAALDWLPDWDVSPAPSTREDEWHRWAGEERGRRVVSRVCKRGDRDIHVELVAEPQVLFLYTDRGEDLSASMRDLYETLQERCEGLPGWDEVEEQRQGGEKYPDRTRVRWALGGSLVLFLVFVGGIGLAVNAFARGEHRPAQHR